jgi:site-specific recombinase XerC
MPKISKAPGAKKYHIWYTDWNGRRRKKVLSEDRETSERRARHLLNQVDLKRDGIVDEADERYAEHERTPLTDHLDDYLRVLKAEGAGRAHVWSMRTRVRRMLALTTARRISDLSASRMQEAVGRIRAETCTGTANRYARAVKSFSRWLSPWGDNRTREYHLAALKLKDAKNDRRRVYRRLTDEELARVVAAAERDPAQFKNLAGPDRAVLYRIACGTGFRAAECRSLTPERFHLDGDEPTITVLGCHTKNRKEAVQPIAPALAELIRPWLAGKSPKQPVFGKLTGKTSEMLVHDLETAGVPCVTDDGEAHFHSFRVTYISRVVESGASVKTCQELARHATPDLTIGLYAKTTLRDIRGTIERLPEIGTGAPAPEAAAMRATGTDGGRAYESANFDAGDEAGCEHKLVRENTLRMAGETSGEISKNSSRNAGHFVKCERPAPRSHCLYSRES